MDSVDIQWEYLSQIKEFENIENNNLNIYIQRLNIQRDTQYNIIMRVSVNDISRNDERKLKNLSTLIFKHDYEIFQIKCSYKQTERYFKYYEGKYIFTYNVSKVKRKKTTYKKAKCIEYYLNGPNYKSNHLIFCQHTQYHENRKERLNSNATQPIKNKSKILLNQFTIDCPDTNFKKLTVESVEDKYEPAWSNSISIEYHKIPSDKEKKKIHDILNFIFGTYLIHVGSTTLDTNGKITNQESYNPIEGFDVQYTCNLPEKSILLPIIITPNKPEIILKKVSHIINTFLKLDENLTQTLHLYNQSLISNPNIEIIVLDAAIDSFAQTMGYTGPAKQRIYSFIYDCGIAKKKNKQITLGKVEDNLRNIRNKITHGEIISDKQELYSSNLAYRVLYGRILSYFLKLNKYYDLTTGKIRLIGEEIDYDEYHHIQNLLKKERYDNSRKYYMDLFKLIKKMK